MKVKQRTVCVCVCVLPDVTGRVLVLVGFELGMAEQHALPQRRLRYSQATWVDSAPAAEVRGVRPNPRGQLFKTSR